MFEHYVVVEAKTFDDAVDIVNRMFKEWARPWQTLKFKGVIREDGEKCKCPQEYSIENINQYIRSEVLKNPYTQGAFAAFSKMLIHQEELCAYELKNIEYWANTQYAKKVFELDSGTFDIMENSFKPGHYDEAGVTNNLPIIPTKGLQAFIVIIEVFG